MHFVVSFNVTICIFLMYFVNRGFVDCAYFDLRYTFPGGEITSEEPEGLSGGAIAGIVIGCILGVLLIEYGVFALLYKKKFISGAFFGKIYPFIKD